jgi:hypothetical protein
LRFDLPPLKSAEDGFQAMSAVLSAVAAGEITLGEAVEVAKLVESCVRALEAKEFDDRLKLLEAAFNASKSD